MNQERLAVDKSQSLQRQDGRITALPTEVADMVKSSATITSLNHVILGLLENAIDSGATVIDIKVQQSRGSCSIEDNGYGILPAEFTVTGGLGKMNRGLDFQHQANMLR